MRVFALLSCTFLALFIHSCGSQSKICSIRERAYNDTCTLITDFSSISRIVCPYEIFGDSSKSCAPTVSSDEFDAIGRDILSNIDSSLNPCALILFVDKYFDKVDTLAFDDIVGLMVLSKVNDDRYIHRVYYKKDGKLVENLEFRLFTKHLLNSTVMDYFKKNLFVFKKASSFKHSKIVLCPNNFAPVKSPQSLKDDLSSKVILLRQSKKK